jgi:hypothetical protein
MATRVIQYTEKTAAAIRSAGGASVDASAQGVEYKGRRGYRKFPSPFEVKSFDSKNREVVLGAGYLKIRGRGFYADDPSTDYELSIPSLADGEEVYIIASVETGYSEYEPEGDTEAGAFWNISVFWGAGVPADNTSDGTYYMPLYKVLCEERGEDEDKNYSVIFDLRNVLVI